MGEHLVIDSNLRDLLGDVFTKGGKSPKYYCNLDPEGEYTLPETKEDVTKFWFEYCKLAYDSAESSDGTRPVSNLCLSEKPGSDMPVVANIKLVFNRDDNRDYAYDEDTIYKPFIRAIIHAYQEVFIRCLELQEQRYELVALVQTYDYLIEDINTSQVEVHFLISFPYCRLNTDIIRKVIRPDVIKELREINAFRFLTAQPINDWDSIIDDKVTQKPFPLYRSIVNARTPTMYFSQIYPRITEDQMNGEDDVSELELETVFDPGYHQHVQNNLFDRNKFVEVDEDTSEPYIKDIWLPMFFSLNFWPNTTPLKPEFRNRIPTHHSSNSMANGVDIIEANQKTEDELAYALLPMISKNRAKTYHDWLMVGKSLYNCYNGNARGLQQWINFCSRSEHTEDNCRKEWSKLHNDNWGSSLNLGYMARQDSPESYKKWHLAWCLPQFKQATECTHTDVANAMKKFYWLDFVCSNPEKSGVWYQYKNPRWVKIKGATVLRNLVSGDFCNQFEQMRAIIAQEIVQTNDPDQKSIKEKSMQKIGRLIRQLKMVTFKNQVMKEAVDKFYEGSEDFAARLDAHPKLFVVQNAVIECNDRYAAVRTGLPQDYVSKVAGTYWDPTFTWQHPLVLKVMKWMFQMLHYPDLVDHVLQMIASCLIAGNNDKIFPIFTGWKDNSKSMFKKLCECVFGSYCITFPIELLTAKKQNAGGPSPEIARADKVRMAWLQEPDTEDRINNGPLKVYCGGGDTFYARHLNEEGGDIAITFTTFMMANKVPIVPGSDDAVKERWRITPFDSTWVNAAYAPATEEEQNLKRLYPKDAFFSEQIPEMAPAMLWIMVQKYADYKNNKGLQIPQQVKEATDAYWLENDVYRLFSTENISVVYVKGTEDTTKIRDPSIGMTASQIYSVFKEWWADSFGGKRPERSTMVRELDRLWGSRINQMWQGVRVKQVGNDMFFNTGG